MNILEQIKVDLTTKDYDLNQVAKLMWQTSVPVAQFYVQEGNRRRKDLRMFAKLMATKTASSAILMVSEENKKGSIEHAFPIEYVAFLHETVEIIKTDYKNNRMKHLNDEDFNLIIEVYMKAIMNILTPRTETLVSQGIPVIVAVETLSIVPTPMINYDDRVIGPNVGKIIRVITRLASLEVEGSRLYEPAHEEDIVRLFQLLFGKENLSAVGRSILLNANKASIPNEDNQCMITLAGATILENAPKKELKHEMREIIKFKMPRRSGNAPTIRMDSVDLEAFPKVAKRAKKEVEKQMNAPKEEPTNDYPRKQKSNNPPKRNYAKDDGLLSDLGVGSLFL